MSEPMTSQSAFSFPDQSSFSTQQATFNSFSHGQTYNTSKPVTTSQPNPQTTTNFQNQQFQQYHTATLSSNNAKFPYLKKDEYETWAIKMEYWIMNTDHNLWKIIQNGNSKKSLGRDSKGGIIILPPTPLRNIEIWLAVKARFGGNEESKKMRKTMLKQAFLEFSVSEEDGLHKGYDRFQKILSQLNQMQAKPDNDDVNIKFLRALPPSWSQVALTLKTRGGLEYISFDDLYNKLRSLEIDNEHDAENKTKEAEQVYGLMVGFESDFAVHAGNAACGVNPAAAEFSMMGISPKVQTCPFGCDSKLSDLKKNYEHLEKLYNDSFIQVQAHKNTVKTLELQKDWYHHTQLALEEKVRILSANLENTINTLKYSETLYAQAKIEKQEWEIKFVESLARFDKWQESSKNLAKLLYSSMSTRTKLGLGFKEYIRSDEVCDLFTPSVFDPTPENKEVKSLYESDKISASETYNFASCVLSPKTNDSFSTVDVKLLPKSDVKDPSLTNSLPNCSFLENVKPPRNLYNFSSVVSKATSIPAGSRNSSASIHAGRSIPAASRNRSASIHAGRTILAASRNRSASIHAGRSIPAASRIDQHLFMLVKGGTVTFGGGDGKITGKGTIRTSMLNFKNVYYVEELQNFNLFFVSQICDKKNKVLFTNDEYLVLSKEFQLPDESQTINKLAKHGLVEGLPLKLFTNEHNCVACNKEKQHKVSYKAISAVRIISEPLQLLHMDIFGPTSIKSIDHKYYSLVVTDDFMTILNTSDHLGKFEGKANDGFLVGYAAHSTQADDSDSECDEQVILVPSFPSNSFSGPTVHDVSAPMENNLDYAEELARLQRQEYEAHSATAKHGFEFSDNTAVLLHQAEIETRRNLVLAAGDPAGSIVSTGGVPTGSVPASGVFAGSLLACIVSASGVPAGSVPASGVPAVNLFLLFFPNDPATTSPLPPVHSLGSYEHTTRFPSPSDHGNHQPTTGIFSSSSYNDDFYADVTNIASNVDVDPVATKRVNIIHPQSQIIGALQSPVQTRSTVQKSKFGESAFISYVHNQNRTNHADHLHCLFACFLSQLEPSSVAKALEDPNWVAAMQEEIQQFYHQQVWKLVPLPAGKIAIGTKWILKNKQDARGIVVRNKARLVAQGHRQDEGIDYDEVYVDDIIFGSTNKSSCDEIEVLMKGEFEMSAMGELTFFLGDSDYAGSHGDRKSTTGGCQFLGRRLISWQCKKQLVVATSSTEAKYIVAASCCGQVLWIQNQMLDYGFNFMHTKISIDNQSTICIVKNPVFHQRTKHIEIQHHFIRDAYEKNLIQVVKIHTDEHVADLLTKAFDGPRFYYLIIYIGMLNP
nr:putative ribonuclease H-like domain-containing protein [Tanacetum cinerariifolium]